MKKPIEKEQAETVLSPDPVRALQDMMLAIDALRAVYMEETKALKTADTKAFFEIQPRKITAAQNYHAGIVEAVARKDELLQVHPQMRSLFRRKQEEFSTIANENLEALDRMRRTTDRLGNRIMQAARDAAVRNGVSYGARGNMAGYKNRPVTMGLNESA